MGRASAPPGGGASSATSRAPMGSTGWIVRTCASASLGRSATRSTGGVPVPLDTSGADAASRVLMVFGEENVRRSVCA